MTGLRSACLRSSLLAAAAALALLPEAAYAEVLCALGSNASAYNQSADQRPSADTMQVVKRVDSAFLPFCLPHCPEAAMLRNDTAPNLMLTVNQDGGKLVYAPQFFASVYSKFGESALIALIGHVYGHAIDEAASTAWMPASWTAELHADAWSGCALAKASLAPTALQPALAALAAYPPQASQGKLPSWAQRAAAARAGFLHCGGDAAKFDAAAKQVKAP